jgi:acetylornithine deacetylase/succinyl-diaminopimelate desuccinylase-like protein
MLTLKRQGVALDRDVIYVATSDEEIGGVLGAGDVAKNHRAALHNAEYVLNEGGNIAADASGRTLYYGILVAEKAPFWLEVIARGLPGHGSVARPETAPNRLVRALERVRTWRTPVTVTAPAEAYFRAIAPTVPAEFRPFLADIRRTTRDSAALARLTAVPGINALLRNTVSITVIQGSNKTNVIPPEVRAELDVRLLPGQTQEAFLAELRRVIADDSVEVKPLGIGWPAPVSSTDNAFYQAIAAVAQRLDPGAAIAPLMQTGFTDCHYFIELGMSCYGLAPFRIPEVEGRGVHGNDERLSIENLRYGTRFIFELLQEVGR